MSFAQHVLKSYSRFLRLYTAIVDNQNAWYIIRVERLKLDRYLHDTQSGKTITLGDYGEVLHKGWGIAPPEELMMEIRNQYQ